MPAGELDWLVIGVHVPPWAPAAVLGIAGMSALAPVLFSWLVLAGLFAGSGVVNGIPPPEQGWPWPPSRCSSEGDEADARGLPGGVRPPSRAPAYEDAKGQTGCPADDPALACPLA
jgi:hypothetical protein